MNKRLLTLGATLVIVTATLILSAGCGSSTDSEIQVSAPIETPAPTPAPTPEPTPEPVVVTTAYGRPRTESGRYFTIKTENYCGSLSQAGLTYTFPQGGDVHGVGFGLADVLFPESGGSLESIQLFITDSGMLDVHFTTNTDGFREYYTDVYQGTLVDGNVEFISAQKETESSVVLNTSGFSKLVWIGIKDDAGGSYSDLSYLVISTEDAKMFEETGILPGYNDAPFLDSIREVLTYAYRVTETVYPGGAPNPLPTQKPLVVTSYGRPGIWVAEKLDENTNSPYTIESIYSTGAINTGLTFSTPQGGNERNFAPYFYYEETIDAIVPKQPQELGSVELYVTDSGTMFMDLTANTYRFDGYYTDVYNGTLVDGNIEYAITQEESEASVTLEMTGFSRLTFVGFFDDTYFYRWFDVFVISTKDANTFMDTGVLPSYENLPPEFLDSLREELIYAYKITEPINP